MGNPYSSLASIAVALNIYITDDIELLQKNIFTLLRVEYEECAKFFTCLKDTDFNIHELKQEISQCITLETIQNIKVVPPKPFDSSSFYFSTLNEDQQKLFILLKTLPWVQCWLKKYESFCNNDDDDNK